MARVVPLRSNNSLENLGTYYCKMFVMGAAMALFAAMLSGCARTAPELPKSQAGETNAETEARLNISKSDLSMTCTQLDAAYQQVKQDMVKNNGTIESNRQRNQTVGYFAGFFPPLAAATENDAEAKDSLDKLQQRKDQILYLQSKKC